MSTTFRSRRRTTAGLTVSALVAGTLAAFVVAAPSALAAPGPIAGRGPGNVTADALPTAQIDGVVWGQAIVGNTVYAGGSFANARPAGVAKGGAGSVARPNLMSYTLSTGVMTAWNPSVNGTVKAVEASPDGTRIYIAGSFTSVNGVARNRLAAFSTATGALISSFAPNLDATAAAIVATNSTVYVGGIFSRANGNTRGRLAAFNASDGSVTTWNPNADYNVAALALSPDGSRVFVGGSFQHLGGTNQYGLAAVSSTSGAVVNWPVNRTVKDAGSQSGITSLSTDGTNIFGTGFVFGGGGNLEGGFSANPTTGSINWIEDCHGDTYDAFEMADTVYTVSHQHFCGNIGAFPETNPRTFHHTTAFTTQATGTIAHETLGYADWFGHPSPSQLNWYPDMTVGSYTGQSQSAWTVTGNGQYLVEGGEFPTVNNTAQQGLVRFAVSALAPNKQGPRLGGSSMVPTLSSPTASTIKVSFPTNWDRDDLNLNYLVSRTVNGIKTTAYSVNANSTFWNRPTLSFTDAGLVPGSTVTYRVQVSDPSGNTILGDSSAAVTLPGGIPGNKPPVAAFSASAANLTVSFDGSASTDDGFITKYAWDFGDGTAAGSGSKVSHPYAKAGTYTATLTVTDNAGVTSAVSHAVTVGAGPNAALATDTFSRNLTGAWGSAEVGGAWTVSSGTAPWSVGNGVGAVALKTAGSGPTAYLNSLSPADVNVALDTSASAAATGNGIYTTLIARHSGTTDYRLKQVRLATGGIQLALSRMVGGTETTIKSLTLAGVTYTPGTAYRMRFVVKGTGTTTLSGSLWKVGTAEPASPQLTATDSTVSLQRGGAFGIQSYIAGNATTLPVTEQYDNLSITAP